MIIIFLNILFGIIIDTFAELRDEKTKVEEDMHGTCFICGIDAYTFDRYGEGFKKHIRTEHNMWQYLYFVFYLRRKEASEYTGQESFVHEKILSRDLSFFPVGKCMSLKDKVTNAEEEEKTASNNSGPLLADAMQEIQALKQVIGEITHHAKNVTTKLANVGKRESTFRAAAERAVNQFGSMRSSSQVEEGSPRASPLSPKGGPKLQVETSASAEEFEESPRIKSVIGSPIGRPRAPTVVDESALSKENRNLHSTASRLQSQLEHKTRLCEMQLIEINDLKKSLGEAAKQTQVVQDALSQKELEIQSVRNAANEFAATTRSAKVGDTASADSPPRDELDRVQRELAASEQEKFALKAEMEQMARDCQQLLERSARTIQTLRAKLVAQEAVASQSGVDARNPTSISPSQSPDRTPHN